MMKSLPRPWYLTKWSARSDSRRSRNEAADLGADTAIEATARRGAAGDPRGGRRTRPRDGAVGLGVATETAGKAVAAAAGDMADRAGAGPRERVRVGFGRGWRVRVPCRGRCPCNLRGDSAVNGDGSAERMAHCH